MDIMITYKFANQTLRIVSPAIPEQAYFTQRSCIGHRLSPDHVIVPFKERGSFAACEDSRWPQQAEL